MVIFDIDLMRGASAVQFFIFLINNAPFGIMKSGPTFHIQWQWWAGRGKKGCTEYDSYWCVVHLYNFSLKHGGNDQEIMFAQML
jgi:hypothetical protein